MTSLNVIKTKEPARKETVGFKPIIKDEYIEEPDTIQNGYQGKGKNNTSNSNDLLLQPFKVPKKINN